MLFRPKPTGGKVYVSDNFSSGDFSKWSSVSGQANLAGDNVGVVANVVTAGQATYDGTTAPTPPNGETYEAQIWYPYRQGTATISGTSLTSVSGDPFDPGWGTNVGTYHSSIFFVGAYKGVVDTSDSPVTGSVTLVSGDNFVADGSWSGKQISIYSVIYTISSVTDATHLTLTASAGTNTNRPYLGIDDPIYSCSSSTSCTLATSGVFPDGTYSWSVGGIDLNNFFRYSFSAPYPNHVFVKGYVYLQAPTTGGPYSNNRKLIYIHGMPGGTCSGCALGVFDFRPAGSHYRNGAPTLDGTVTSGGACGAATAVCWASGDQFVTDGSWNGKSICLDGNCQYTVSSVSSATALTLDASPAIAAGTHDYAATVAAIGLYNEMDYLPGDNGIYGSTPYVDFNKWYEVEVEYRLNDPGVSNGYYNVWIDGTYRSDLSKTGIGDIGAGETSNGFGYVDIGEQLDPSDWSESHAIMWENEYRYWSDVTIADHFM